MITQPFHNFNSGAIKPLSKFGHWRVIASIWHYAVWLHVQPLLLIEAWFDVAEEVLAHLHHFFMVNSPVLVKVYRFSNASETLSQIKPHTAQKAVDETYS